MANKNPSGADGLRDSSIEAEEILNKSRQNIERETCKEKKREKYIQKQACVTRPGDIKGRRHSRREW